jgi:hypothetical protein
MLSKTMNPLLGYSAQLSGWCSTWIHVRRGDGCKEERRLDEEEGEERKLVLI